MVERYVFVKLKDAHATDEGRAQVVAEARRVLPSAPGAVGVVVGVPADEASARSWDVSIVVRFASAADLEPYREDPAHRRFVDEYLRPRVEVIKAWNFDVG